MKIGDLVIYKDYVGMVISTMPFTIATNTGEDKIVNTADCDLVMTAEQLIAIFRGTICQLTSDQ